MPSSTTATPTYSKRAHDQRHDDAEGQIFLRIARFLGGCRDRIESDVGKENDGASGDDSGEARRREGHPVGGLHQHSADDQEGKDGADFHRHHDVVGLRRLLHSAHQQQREKENDEEAGKIEIRARPLPSGPHRARPFFRQVEAEDRQLRFRITGKANRDRDVRDYVFEDEVPADDPGENFAERRVRICIGAAGDGDHRGQFGVAQSGEAAGDRHQQERNRNRRSGRWATVHERSGGAAGAHEIDDYVERLRVQEGRSLEIFSGGGGPGKNENAGTDDGADTKSGQRPRAQRFAEAVFRVLGVGDQLVDGLAAENLLIGGADGCGGLRGWL